MRLSHVGLAILTSVVWITATASAQPQPTLKIGDPAPPLAQGKYLKGEPVTQFEKGKVYVVEFWATWCGPCRQSIPHITALQQKYKDVIFIGQDCWENDQSQVAGFVKQMGDRMGYRVALDDVSDGSKGKMAMTWMVAAGLNGIPSAFIVDRDSRIAWIGHPMSMDRALGEIVAGTFDPKKEAMLAARRDAAAQKLKTAQETGNPDKVLSAINEVEAELPEMVGPLGMLKFQTLLQKKDYTAAYAQAAQTADRMKDNPDLLNEIAWTIVDRPDLEKRDLDLAMKLAVRANELTSGQRGDILDTLARVYFEKGDLAKAIEIQTDAVSKAPPQLKGDLEATLARYKQAKQKT
jgi:thiol-disulfide isomerase/thioredoxin